MGHPHGDIGRRAAYEFFKVVDLFQGFELLLHLVAVSGVEVNGHPAQQDKVKFSGLVKLDVHSLCLPVSNCIQFIL